MTLQDPRSGEVVEKELYVTRKGATPAAEGQMGLIPGSMGQILHHAGMPCCCFTLLAHSQDLY